MKRVYVIGSFRFADKTEELQEKLAKENIKCETSKKTSAGIAGCLEKIDKADLIYVVDSDGYVGKSVCVDIGYALAKNKPVYVMRPIVDPPLMNLVRGVLSFEALIRLLKDEGDQAS